MPVFLDTNIIVYAFTDDPRAAVAERLLAHGGEISVQVLNEFANVAQRKLGFDWQRLAEALGIVRTLATKIHAVDLACHIEAMTIAERFGVSIYDGLIVASALGAGCDTLYSEDMHDGLKIGAGLKIVNPF